MDPAVKKALLQWRAMKRLKRAAAIARSRERYEPGIMQAEAEHEAKALVGLYALAPPGIPSPDASNVPGNVREALVAVGEPAMGLEAINGFLLELCELGDGLSAFGQQLGGLGLCLRRRHSND